MVLILSGYGLLRRALGMGLNIPRRSGRRWRRRCLVRLARLICGRLRGSGNPSRRVNRAALSILLAAAEASVLSPLSSRAKPRDLECALPPSLLLTPTPGEEGM